MFNNIYKNKKVLVTGHTGFKGSWLSLWLTELHADVIGYSLEAPTVPNLFSILELEKKIKHYTADILDYEKLVEVIKIHKPEIIFHLAAKPIVRYSYKEPKLTFETNVIGTVNILEAAREFKNVKVVVNITSDKCYENKEWVYGYRETDPIGGFDPYSSSKGCAEFVISAYRNSFFNPKDFNTTHNTSVSSVRAGNVIGGGDWAEDRLVPDCIRALTNNETIILRNPKATRPWQHVLEPLSGYLLLGAMMYDNQVKYSGAWNFGPSDEDVHNVSTVVDSIIKIWGNGSFNIENNKALHEAHLLKLDISKAKHLLNWKPVYSAVEAIEKTIEWYKNYYEKKINMREFSINQIFKYIEVAKKKELVWSN